MPSHTITTTAGGRRRTVRRPFVLFAAAIFLTCPQVPRAVTMEDRPPQLSITDAGGVYTVSARFDVGGAADTAVAVLTDYERIPQFMPGVKTSIVLTGCKMAQPAPMAVCL